MNEPVSPASKVKLDFDSPWFWLAMFACAALAALAAIGPKYLRREAGVEQKYLARQEAARRQADNPTNEAPAEFEAPPMAGSANAPATQPRLIVPLWRLAGVLLVVAVLAVVMWLCVARRDRRPEGD